MGPEIAERGDERHLVADVDVQRLGELATDDDAGRSGGALDDVLHRGIDVVVERRQLGAAQVLLAARADPDDFVGRQVERASRGSRGTRACRPRCPSAARSTLPIVAGSIAVDDDAGQVRRARDHDLALHDRRGRGDARDEPHAREDVVVAPPRRRRSPCRSTMCALLPRIFRFRSWLKPPMTLTTLESAHDESATPQIDSTLMTVRNPLFGERTCRAPTNDENVRPSRRSRSQGRRSASDEEDEEHAARRSRRPSRACPSATTSSRGARGASSRRRPRRRSSAQTAKTARARVERRAPRRRVRRDDERALAGGLMRCLGAQEREENDVADRRRVRERHHQAVDAHAEPGRRRHAVLERADVVLVVVHRLFGAALLLLDLRAEAGRPGPRGRSAR